MNTEAAADEPSANAVARLEKRRAIAGVAWMLGAVCLWSGWLVATRFGVTGNLTAFDIAAIRAIVPALILFPFAVRRFDKLRAVGPKRALMIGCGAGAPYAVVSTTGLGYAPAAHGAAMMPTLMPTVVALISVLLFRERLAPGRWAGLGLIVAGATGLVVATAAGQAGLSLLPGHAMFAIAASMWAGYTLALRGIQVTALEATTILAAVSFALYVPLYMALAEPRIFDRALLPEILLQALYQGLVAGIVALFFYARGVAALGPSRASAFAALVPVIAALMGIVFLGERPSTADWIFILVVSAGVYLATGAPLPKGPNQKNRAA